MAKELGIEDLAEMTQYPVMDIVEEYPMNHVGADTKSTWRLALNPRPE
ncbi:MAG: hypothetical protein O3B95_05890 [Chloroflexi bacterium]|nr:hypothetical protein [Chloroflexota bacterium]